jgi:hypothetical protein
MRSIVVFSCATAGFLLYLLAILQTNVEAMMILTMLAVFVLFIALMLQLDKDTR